MSDNYINEVLADSIPELRAERDRLRAALGVAVESLKYCASGQPGVECEWNATQALARIEEITGEKGGSGE